MSSVDRIPVETSNGSGREGLPYLSLHTPLLGSSSLLKLHSKCMGRFSGTQVSKEGVTQEEEVTLSEREAKQTVTAHICTNIWRKQPFRELGMLE